MAVLKRAQVAAPTLPKETVAVDALGGEVIVRGLLLTERIALTNRIATLRMAANPQPAKAKAGAAAAPAGPVKAQAYDPATDVQLAMPMLLALCVLDADSEPLWTDAQWQVFGGQHQGQALALFNVAWRLSGFDQAPEAKN